MAANSPFETCDLILRHVKTSCLNFAIQETPFSVYLTIRKSFSQSPRRPADNTSSLTAQPQPLGPNKLETELETLKKEFKFLKSQRDSLERVKDDISVKFEEEVILSEHLTQELTSKNEKLLFMHAKFEELEDKAAKIENENKKLV
jgi:DNA repair exonuclease SbcCD ATPase subunit